MNTEPQGNLTNSGNWIANNLEDIYTSAKKINQGRSDWQDLAHYAIEQYLSHPLAEKLAAEGTARWFIVRILMNSARSSSSEYYRVYRRSHGELTDNEHEDKDNYEPVIDELSQEINKELDKMLSATPQDFFQATIFRLAMEQKLMNFSELSRQTGIPRTSISSAYHECKKKLNIKFKKWMN